MKLQINGEERELAEEDVTLAALVEQLGMKADRVAVELNREIVRRDLWPQTRLHTGDRLEIVQFVGGGLNWETEKTLAAEDAEKPSSFLRF
ncbi:MAG TPA: sulfur carrier protein ThiS [Terriglobales bacterium]|jgi:sulfur carrier protein